MCTRVYGFKYFDLILTVKCFQVIISIIIENSLLAVIYFHKSNYNSE